MSLDKCTHPGKPHHGQANKYIHHLHKFPQAPLFVVFILQEIQSQTLMYDPWLLHLPKLLVLSFSPIYLHPSYKSCTK